MANYFSFSCLSYYILSSLKVFCFLRNKFKPFLYFNVFISCSYLITTFSKLFTCSWYSSIDFYCSFNFNWKSSIYYLCFFFICFLFFKIWFSNFCSYYCFSYYISKLCFSYNTFWNIEIISWSYEKSWRETHSDWILFSSLIIIDFKD